MREKYERMGAANDNIEEVAYFKIFPWLISIERMIIANNHTYHI